MWSEDPTKSVLVDERSSLIEPEQIAEAMYDLVVQEELGNGTIYECGINGTRVVSEYYTEPPGPENMMPGYVDESHKIFERLKTEGMKA